MAHENQPRTRTAPKTDNFHRVIVAPAGSTAEVYDPESNLLERGYTLDPEESKGRRRVYKAPNEQHAAETKANAERSKAWIHGERSKKVDVSGKEIEATSSLTLEEVPV